MIGTFRKKPVAIEAIQFTGGNHQDVSAFMGCECGFGNPVRDDCPYDHSKVGPRFVFIRTLEGTHRADRGDWIIRGVAGEYYPCKPEIFEQTYEPADPGLSKDRGEERLRERLLGDEAKEALLRSRESRHVDPPERGSEDWQCWEGDAEEDLAAVAETLPATTQQPHDKGGDDA